MMNDLKAKHIVLIGDSIFDNDYYVNEGESVVELLQRTLEHDDKVTLLAKDGDVTASVTNQLIQFPNDATHVFVSCGGNDALQMIHTLNAAVSTVGEALEMMIPILVDKFRQDYRTMLKNILGKHQKVMVCTLYNQIPSSSGNKLEVSNDPYNGTNTISERALVALA